MLAEGVCLAHHIEKERVGGEIKNRWANWLVGKLTGGWVNAIGRKILVWLHQCKPKQSWKGLLLVEPNWAFNIFFIATYIQLRNFNLLSFR